MPYKKIAKEKIYIKNMKLIPLLKWIGLFLLKCDIATRGA